MASQSEAAWAFYSAGSGLTPASNFSLFEHKLAWLKLNGASGAYSMYDAETKAWGAGGEYAFLVAATGSTGSLTELRNLWFNTPVVPNRTARIQGIVLAGTPA